MLKGLPNHSITRTTSNCRTCQARPRARHTRRSDVVGNDARPCPTMHQERSRRPNHQTKDVFEGCVDRREKRRRIQESNVHRRTHIRRTEKLGRSSGRRTRWSCWIPSVTSIMWTDTFGKAEHWAKWRKRHAGKAAHRVSSGSKDCHRKSARTEDSREGSLVQEEQQNTPTFFVFSIGWKE